MILTYLPLFIVELVVTKVGSRKVKAYCPSSLTVNVRLSPVEVCVNVIAAPGVTCPLASVTLPLSVAVAVCALMAPANEAANNNVPNRSLICLRIVKNSPFISAPSALGGETMYLTGWLWPCRARAICGWPRASLAAPKPSARLW